MNRESRNGNRYTLLVTDTADWIYVWDRAWRRELRQQYGCYYELDAVIYVRAHSGDNRGAPRYDLEALLPQSQQLTSQFIERWQRQHRSELFDAVEKCRRRRDSPQQS